MIRVARREKPLSRMPRKAATNKLMKITSKVCLMAASRVGQVTFFNSAFEEMRY